MVYGLWFMVYGLGFRVWGLGFRVWGSYLIVIKVNSDEFFLCVPFVGCKYSKYEGA